MIMMTVVVPMSTLVMVSLLHTLVKLITTYQTKLKEGKQSWCISKIKKDGKEYLHSTQNKTKNWKRKHDKNHKKKVV